ncbi:MAG: AlkA N-terminal domain-containing protein [Gordonia sp. (in: high G+C Gram-positive bacteria)]|uniref:DNA-3-methyladenine glycosylase family protein n=1 Tax=Gordonia sp. (in: high G+C Gram-positive bacteria) TaxID=84139 RepID=UPI003C7164AA
MSEVRLAARGAFDHRAALAVLRAHRVDGLGDVDAAGAFRRLVQTDDGTHLVSARFDDQGVTIGVDTADGGVVEAIAARARHWFDLDTDLAPINAHLRADRLLTEHVDRRPGLRLTRAAEPFEAVVQTVLGQQVTLAAGRTFGARLVAAYGVPDRRGLVRFPAPHRLAAVPVDELQRCLRITGARARTVHGVAEYFTGRVPGAPLPSRVELAALYGIGAWTLDYLAVRAGADPDAFPASDAVLRRMLRGAGAGADAAADTARWSPYRSYAAFRLWAMSGMWPGSA